MKTFIAAAVSALVLSLSACDNGADGTLESCASSLVGSFEGDQQGGVTAALRLDGSLTVAFLADGEEEPYDGDSAVDESGVLSPNTNRLLRVTGTIDFSDACAVQDGVWERGEDSGTWQAALR